MLRGQIHMRSLLARRYRLPSSEARILLSPLSLQSSSLLSSPHSHGHISCRGFSQTSKPPGTEKNESYSAALGRMVRGVATGTRDLALNPSKIPPLLRATWTSIKDEAYHYWLGTKLLWSEMKLASAIIKRILQGHAMTRRERMQLIRTAMDMFRLVPFAIFVIVPFMELLLPVALKLFPNMLPSTFTDSLKREENMKKELQMRIAIAGFFQETVHTMAAEKHKKLKGGDTGAQEIISFFEKVRLGEQLPNHLVIKMAQLFEDELMLPNIQRPQLVSMCQYMGLAPYGADAFLRFQLRSKLRAIKEDDRRILWEGQDSLTPYETREACQERGMSAYGLTDFEYKRQLREWLDLSIQKNVPISLLIMSRGLGLQEDLVLSGEQLRNSLSSFDENVINEAVLKAARPEEANTVGMKARKLESLQFQEEMIEEERMDQKGAAVKRKDVGRVKDATDPQTDVDKRQNLSLNEMQALSDLAEGGIGREKSELQELRSKSKEGVATSAPLHASKTPSAGAIVVGDSVMEEEEDADLVRMKKALNSMLDTLTVRINSTEVALGDRLKLLDLDLDGEVSIIELKTTIAKILKRATTDEEAEELARLLDKDKDGKVSVAELRLFVESSREKQEVHELEAQVKVKPLLVDSSGAEATARQ